MKLEDGEYNGVAVIGDMIIALDYNLTPFPM